MVTWKYQKQRKKSNWDAYMHFLPDQVYELEISDWNFKKNPDNDSLFCTAVSSENGQAVDKIWSVWDYSLKEQLKKHLKPFSSNRDKVKFRITRHVEDEEESFVLEYIPHKEMS